MTDFLKSHAKKLYLNGYPIIPIGKGLKHPGKKYSGWQDTVATPTLAKKWINDQSVTGVGILTATTPAIDIDVRDDEIVEQILDYLQEQGLYDWESIKRTGEAPKVLIPYRLEENDGGFSKIQSSTYAGEDGCEHKIEILGIGQQFVAYHIHPDTKNPYHYNDGLDLIDVKYSDLPTLNAFQAKALVDWFEQQLVPSTGWKLKDRKNTQAKTAKKSSTLKDNDTDFLDNVSDPLHNISLFKVIKTLEGIDPDCSYDTWARVGMGLWHQFTGEDAGFEIFKTWSRRGSKYKKGDASKSKWNSFEPDYERGAPITFAYALSLVDPSDDHDEIPEIRELIPEDDDTPSSDDSEYDSQHGEEHQGELILPKIGSKARKKLDKYLSKYVYVGHKQLIIDKSKPPYEQAMEWKDFERMNSNQLIEVGKPLKTDPDNTVFKALPNVWLNNADRETVTGFKYSPGEKRFFKNDNNTRYANSFSFPDHKKIAKRCKIDYEGKDRLDVFFDHIQYVFPNKDEREWFLQWVAFVIQCPHKRCPIAPIHIARTPGIGRSWILRVITRMLGPENVNTVDIEQIIGENSPFNDHLVDCKVIACEELRIGDGKDRYKVENTLKSDVTDSRKQIRRKYGTQLTEDLFGCFIFFSNFMDCLPLPADDRRYNVFSGPSQKRSSAYYDKLLSWLDDFNNSRDEVDANVAQLFNYFSNLDLSDFKLDAPLDTPARRAMISMSKSDTEHLYESFMSETPSVVLSALDIQEIISSSEALASEQVELSRITGVLKQRATSLGRILVNGTHHRLWSLDNTNYEYKQAVEIYKQYLDTKHDDDFDD